MERAEGNLSNLIEVSLGCTGALLSQVLKLAFWGKDLRKPRSPVRVEAYHIWMKKAAGIYPNLEKQATLPWQLWISTRQPGMPLNIMLNSSMRRKPEREGRGPLPAQGTWVMSPLQEGSCKAHHILSLVYTGWEMPLHRIHLYLKRDSPKEAKIFTYDSSAFDPRAVFKIPWQTPVSVLLCPGLPLRTSMSLWAK